MGGLISCQSECFNASSLVTPWNSYRFAAEIYKLSDDRRQWIKMHPSILSITMHPSILSITVRGQTTQNGQIAELDAMNLQRENVCKFSIHSHNEIKRCSDRFIYWKAQDGVYALNVISRSDVDNFCSLVASTSKTSQPTNSVAHRFHVQLAKLMSLRHGTIVEAESLVFTDGSLVIHPPDSLAFLDSGHNCMLCISM
uniref:Uncharacterized protein n=1 Tax=Acrobeloides nanus TaxID=290746 RepID=A0A914E8S3_9BILA